MARQPNILVILSDQHAPDVMACAGDPVVRTPSLDALAARGVRFDNAYCAAPICVPSRMTMLTGRHCSDIGVWSNHCYLSSDIPTFAHALGAVGYETVLCGRMHFIGPDQRHGFHERIIGDVRGYNHPGGPLAKTGPLLKGTAGSSLAAVATSGAGRTVYQAYDRAVFGRAQQFLREREDERPLLMVVGSFLPHNPFVARKDLYDYYYYRVEIPEIPDGYLESLSPAMKKWREARGITELSDEQVRVARAGYYGMVEQLDDSVGELLHTLRGTGMDEDTVVVYLSDHGELAGHNGMWWKGNFYDRSVSVPMIMAGPGLPEGQVRPEVVSLLDLAPTLSDLAGAPQLPFTSGQSLLPLVHDELCSPWRDEALAEMLCSWLDYYVPGRMIRQGAWKLMHHVGQAPLLFNLDDDPNEFHDRAADPECRGVREYLHDRVRSGWDPEGALQRIRRSREGVEVIRNWARDVPASVHAEDYWEAPDDCNTFPE